MAKVSRRIRCQHMQQSNLIFLVTMFSPCWVAFVLSQTCFLFNTSLALGNSSTGYRSIHVTFGGLLTSIWHSFICWMLSQCTMVRVSLVRRRGKQKIVHVWLTKLVLCLTHKPKGANLSLVTMGFPSVISLHNHSFQIVGGHFKFRFLHMLWWWEK